MVKGGTLICVPFKPLWFSIMSVILLYFSLPILPRCDTTVIQQKKFTLYIDKRVFSVGITSWIAVNNPHILESSDIFFLLYSGLNCLVLLQFRNHNSAPICMLSPLLQIFLYHVGQKLMLGIFYYMYRMRFTKLRRCTKYKPKSYQFQICNCSIMILVNALYMCIKCIPKYDKMYYV